MGAPTAHAQPLTIEQHLARIEALLASIFAAEGRPTALPPLVLPAPTGAGPALVVTLPFQTDKLRLWNTTADGNVKELIAPNRDRVRVTIVNNGAATVNIGIDQRSVAGAESYPLAALGALPIDSYTGSIYVFVPTGTIVALGLIELSRPSA